jgi:hypothetical protein
MKLVLVAALGLLVVAFKPLGDKPVVDKTEAKSAYLFLNKVRANVTAYAKELELPANIKISTQALVWNDTLAKVAETKALDMATRNYFAHVDAEGNGMNFYINKAGYKLKEYQLKTKRQNSYESISAGQEDGEAVIRDLIIDVWDTNLGHRKHLLGMDGWASTTDIGIGFVRGTAKNEYTTYVSILIATH